MNTLSSPKTLRAILSSGIALVVISMLFLGREVEGSPVLVKIMMAAATPTFFYITGGWVYRHLNAPLAAPGIVATGAWLVAVELLHFYDQRHLLPDFARTYYWLLAATFAAVVITLTGHKARIWLLVPLVPLAQINATWAVMDVTGLDIAWWPVLSFLLVLAWWEVPLHDEEWQRVYRVSAVLLEVFLLIFSYWLPAQTANSMLITWGTCALLVGILSLRHGWVNLGPLAIVLLALAVAWGFPAAWWGPIWLVIGIGTVIYIERLARHDDEAHTLALDMSTALAVLLSGTAALHIELLEFYGGAVIPMVTVSVLLGSGGLMIWLGKRRELTTAVHAGLWLLAAAWAEIYHAGLSDSGTFGLWLSLLAVMALLTERLLLSATRQKHKGLSSIQEAFMRWPLADLVVGLSVIIVIWTALAAFDIPATDPEIVAMTLSVVIGVWLAAGLLYRMPALLHVALWLAPLPYALFLVWNVQAALYRLPLLGVAWQILARHLSAGRALAFSPAPGHARAVFHRGLCAARLRTDAGDPRSDAAGGRVRAGDPGEFGHESHGAGGRTSGLGCAGHPADPARRAPLCLPAGAAGVCFPDGVVSGDLVVSDAWLSAFPRAAAGHYPGADVQRVDHVGAHPAAPAGNGRLAGLRGRVVHVADRFAASLLLPGGSDDHGHLRVGAQRRSPVPLESDSLDAGVYPANSVQCAANRLDAACSRSQPDTGRYARPERGGDVVRTHQSPGGTNDRFDRGGALAGDLGDFL